MVEDDIQIFIQESVNGDSTNINNLILYGEVGLFVGEFMQICNWALEDGVSNTLGTSILIIHSL
jgi:hypothetical protein